MITFPKPPHKASKQANLNKPKESTWISLSIKPELDPKFVRKSKKFLKTRDRNYDLVHLQPKNRTHLRTRTCIELKPLKNKEKVNSPLSTTPSLSPPKTIRANLNSLIELPTSSSPELTSCRRVRRSNTLKSISPRTDNQELESIISGASQLHSQTRSLKRHFSLKFFNIQKDFRKFNKFLEFAD
ncbi:unnamed protein product [Blepharisma stoltei]|uniref:Uncharacterized protein n=1 Tax=Blepharisma stoltei TaxID=1481888 RepID=A0AAU9ILU3_9CILI|nr:unnamed protein product [Blepharisma stoltei]